MNSDSDTFSSITPLIVRGKGILHKGVNQENLAKLLEANKLFSRAVEQKNQDVLAMYYLGLSYYRMANVFLAQNKQSDGLKTIDESINCLREAARLNCKYSESFALLSCAYGRKVGIKKYFGATLGPLSYNALKRSIQLNPNNPRTVFAKALNMYHRPRLWGGNRQEAINIFKTATKLFSESNCSSLIHPSWGHDESFAWLGKAYMSVGELVKAKSALSEALEINPHSHWVKCRLMTDLDERKLRRDIRTITH